MLLLDNSMQVNYANVQRRGTKGAVLVMSNKSISLKTVAAMLLLDNSIQVNYANVHVEEQREPYL